MYNMPIIQPSARWVDTLGPPHNTDLDFRDCFGRKNLWPEIKWGNTEVPISQNYMNEETECIKS